MIAAYVDRVADGQDLTMDEMSAVIDQVMQGGCSGDEIAGLLTALNTKGETVAEVAGAAAAMRKHMTPIRCEHPVFVDTCGTGGDGSGTFNISTAAALVTAAAGVPVAKHGNRKITSKTGSADVLACLGVNIEADVPTVERCLNELGIGFCFAPLLHGAMKHVAAVRRSLGVPTIFNLLGPLANPAGAPFQVLGVGRPPLRPLLSEALRMLGVRHAVVVCGRDGLDEVTLAEATDVSHVTTADIATETWRPADFGLGESPLDSLTVDGPQASADMIRAILDGQGGPAADIVVLNAAAAIWITDPQLPKPECAQRAADAIASGAARRLLADLAGISHS